MEAEVTSCLEKMQWIILWANTLGISLKINLIEGSKACNKPVGGVLCENCNNPQNIPEVFHIVLIGPDREVSWLVDEYLPENYSEPCSDSGDFCDGYPNCRGCPEIGKCW